MKLKLVGIFWMLCMACTSSFAQRSIKLNMEEHDSKLYYFGINFGYNQAAYRISHPQNFTTTDTFYDIQSRWGSGFHLGLLGSLRLNSFVDLRLVPTLLFANKPIYMTGANITTETKNRESIYMHLPLQFKFKSDRINNFRFYAIAGGKFDYDLSANAKSRRSDEFIKIKPFDMGAELGFGFDFFFSNFILTPEIKLSQGLMNAHFKDSDLKLSNSIDQMRSRMIIFSIMLQS